MKEQSRHHALDRAKARLALVHAEPSCGALYYKCCARLQPRKSRLTYLTVQGSYLIAQGASRDLTSIQRAARAAYRGGVAEVAHGKSGGEGLQVARLGQLRDQALGVADKGALPACARAQVQVQTALKALVDEAVIRRHLSVSQSMSPSHFFRACIRARMSDSDHQSQHPASL